MGLAEYLRLSARDRIAALRDAVYDLRTPASSPESVPDSGVVAVEGVVEAADRTLRSAVTDRPCVLARHRLTARYRDGDRPWVLRDRIVAIPFFVAGPDSGGGDPQGVEPASDPQGPEDDSRGAGREGDPRASGSHGVLVDPAPRRIDEDLEPGPRSAGRAAYVDATIAFPTGREFVRERRAGAVGPGSRLSAVVPDADLADGVRLRYVERRFEPGDRVSVLGQRLPGDRLRADVGNVVGVRSPFRISG